MLPDLVTKKSRRDAAHLELLRIDTLLEAYWTAASGQTAVPPRRYVIKHQEDREVCACTLCVDWRTRRVEVERVQPFMEGHRWGNCPCSTCVVGRQLHFGFLGATNKRDLWTEVSYHAHTDKAYRSQPLAVMTVMMHELEDPGRSLNWWSLEGGRMPMASWFRKIDKALGIVKEAA